MLTTINARVPGSTPTTVALRAVLKVTDPTTDEADYALDSDAAMTLLDAWRSSAPFRGYTCESTGDHDWEWIYAEPTGHGDDRLLFTTWQAASETRNDLPRDRWMLSDFGVAVEVATDTPTRADSGR